MNIEKILSDLTESLFLAWHDTFLCTLLVHTRNCNRCRERIYDEWKDWLTDTGGEG